MLTLGNKTTLCNAKERGVSMNEMKEAVGNWREAKQFSPADENDFLRWLDKADTEEKLFSRLTFWFTFRGLPADQRLYQ